MHGEESENFSSDVGEIAVSIDFILQDILQQINKIKDDKKEASYTKLIELFFKGIDLREKVSGFSAFNTMPPINIIGLDNSKI
jgi:hypothetical protein